MNFEEAMEAVNLKKTALKEAKTALRAFRKENDINPDEEIADEKLAKKHGKLVSAVEKAEAELAESNAAAKELKPKAERTVKYDYPPDLTAADKKKFRAKARAEAKRALKGDAPAKPKKEAKTEEPEAAPVKKKKTKVAEDED